MDYHQRLLEIDLRIIGPYCGAKIHHQLQCLHCNHTWSATPLSKLQAHKKHGNNGCPNCAMLRKEERLQDTRARILDKFKELNLEVLSDWYNGEQTTTKKVVFRSSTCGHVFESAPGNVIHNGVRCTICAADRVSASNKTRNAERVVRWRETASEWELYRSDVMKLTRATYDKYTSLINPKGYKLGLAGTEGSYHLDHIFPIRKGFDYNVDPALIADYHNLQVIDWRSNVFHSDNIKGLVPAHILSVLPEEVQEQQTRLQTITRHFPQARPILDAAATNAFHMTNDVAVMLCSQRSHTSPVWMMGQDRHKVYRQQQALLERGYKRVIVIFSDEWEKIDLVTAKLSHITSTSTADRIHARKCSIREIPATDKNKFLDRFHLQGKDTSHINLGAYYNNTLVAVMTFCRPRVLMGRTSNEDDKWELSRFATNTDYRIPGIASKLLTFFSTNYQWTEIYSYADRRWSDGNVYEQLGFELTATNPPAYWYVSGIERKHRWGFRKDVLKHMGGYDSSETEYANVARLMPQYERLYDCGTLRYTMVNSCTTK